MINHDNLKDRMVPLPDDPNLLRRPGYDYSAQHPTRRLQIVKVIEPEPSRHDLFAASVIRFIQHITRR